MVDYAIGADDAIVADNNAFEYNDIGSDPAIIADGNRAFGIILFGNQFGFISELVIVVIKADVFSEGVVVADCYFVEAMNGAAIVEEYIFSDLEFSVST